MDELLVKMRQWVEERFWNPFKTQFCAHGEDSWIMDQGVLSGWGEVMESLKKWKGVR